MQTEEVIKQLEPWLTKHCRPAWKPVVEEGDGPKTGSKFSGLPWLASDDSWPTCTVCNLPLQLLVQINLTDLPLELERRFGAGLLQLFYCTRNDCIGSGGFEPFADDLSRVRVVQPSGLGQNISLPEQEIDFPAKRIVGWKRFIDLPMPCEHQELGLIYTYDWKASTVRLECNELGLDFQGIKDGELAYKIARSEYRDKLAGWPAWVQNVEYPACPRCGSQMIHVFQVDSNDNVPFMFGDVGCGHITQCPQHKEVVAFGWACH